MGRNLGNPLRQVALLLEFFLLCAVPVAGPLQAAEIEWPALKFDQLVTRQFAAPTSIDSAGDESGRVFITEQAGQVWIIQNNQVLETPFLDIRSKVVSGGERGLLGLAFPPGFAQKRRFYAHYNRLSDGWVTISRFDLTADSNVADPASQVVLLNVPKSFENHNGGQLAFGPDGFLYIAIGDGGGAGDPSNLAQNLNDLRGKILRIDVESGAQPYAIPPSNPFVQRPDARPEIWAYGLRNPWRFSFDRLTGDLFIGDVGQTRFEEINFQPASSAGGENYGWRIMEANAQFNVPANYADFGSLTPPLVSYGTNAVMARFGGASVTGGYVYRGPNEPRLNGVYFYADFNGGVVWGLKRHEAAWANRILSIRPALPDFGISTFGQDEAGNLLVADYVSGKIFKIGDSGEVCPPEFSPRTGEIPIDRLLITSGTPNASIHYTVNGEDPTTGHPMVPTDGYVPISNGATVKARAYRADLLPSSITTGTFTFRVGAPVFNPPPGPVPSNTVVTITSASPNARIHYTLNNQNPTAASPLYTAPFVTAGPLNLRAIGIQDGFANSRVSIAAYPVARAAFPLFDPPQGYIREPTRITLSSSTPNSTIRYTVDGSNPTMSSPIYTGPVLVPGGTTMRAFAVSDGYLDSAISTSLYPLALTDTPAFSPQAGPLEQGATISIASSSPGASIYFTLDGSAPTEQSTLYSNPIAFTGPVTLKARAFAPGLAPSAINSTFFGLLVPESPIVTTVAGTPSAGFVNGPLHLARFNAPTGIAIDSSGSIFVADTDNNAIRKISPEGIVTTIAPNAGFSGPTAVAVDRAGNVFVADSRNCNRVRKIAPDETVTEVAQLAECNRVAALGGMLLGPDDALYVGHWCSVRRISAGQVFLAAGTGVNGNGWTPFVSPALDAAGNLYSATESFLWRTAPGGATEEVYSGGANPPSDGPRSSAGFFSLAGIVIDTRGDIFVSDNSRIRRVTDSSVSTYAGMPDWGFRNGPGAAAQFNRPSAICFDLSGNLLVADTLNHCIRKISPDTRGIGIPDEWQQQYFQSVGIDPMADPDGDGNSNLTEFWAGTNPMDRASALAIQLGQSNAPGDDLRITWQTVAVKTYTVQRSGNLIDWTSVGDQRTGDGSMVTVAFAKSLDPAAPEFFRILVDY